MSRRQLSRLQAISKEEFSGLSKMERLYWHVLFPFEFELTDKEDKYLALMKQVFAVISDELSRSRALQKIDQLAGAEMHPSTRLLNDAEYLFGNMVQTNKNLDRARLWEKYIRLAKKAEKAGDFLTAKFCYDSAAKIKGLWKEDGEMFNYKDVQPPDIVFTNDPQALKPANPVPADDEHLDYEE